MNTEISVWTVFIAALITAICTGLGAIPFFFFKEISRKLLGTANALAAGLMLGASIGLTYEGWLYSLPRTIIGLLLGFALIVVTRRILDQRGHAHVGDLAGANATQILLIMVVMTVHSFAEGIGVGVSFGGGDSFGRLITAAIAIHNIPEGLAIALVMVPRGTSALKAVGWSIFSSLPQPLMAIPAFLFVLVFQPFLPVGLGLAAGAMFYMVFTELLPEAREDAGSQTVYGVLVAAAIAMMAFQFFVG
jgi:zinc transporter ZupT